MSKEGKLHGTAFMYGLTNLALSSTPIHSAKICSFSHQYTSAPSKNIFLKLILFSQKQYSGKNLFRGYLSKIRLDTQNMPHN